MKKQAAIILIACWTLFAAVMPCSAQKKRILYVDSYHPEYLWSTQVTRGIHKILDAKPDIELEIFRMDTKRNKALEFKKTAALRAKKRIETFKPDVVIASDDNAAKYLIVPYYLNTDLPVVFCGINWDASMYGFPAPNVTGMVETSFFDTGLATLKQFAKGGRIGFLSSDTETQQKKVRQLTQRFKVQFNVRLAKTFDQLKRDFLELQEACDMVLIQEFRSVKGFNHESMKTFVNAHTKVPTLAMDNFMVDYALIVYAKNGEEQGEYAARTALQILDGRLPGDIPVTTNKKVRIYLNMTLAKKLGIKFPMTLMDYAQLVSTAQKKLLYINSYHKGYQWSDGIEKGLFKALGIDIDPDSNTTDTSLSPIQVKVVRMDTKRNQGEAFKKKAALKAKSVIETWKPDIVVASDDNACKYVIAPYYVNSDLPVVFCGVNFDASMYGFPAPNITGMVEAGPYAETIALMKQFSRGNRIGLIGTDTLSNRKEIAHLKKRIDITNWQMRLVSSFNQWKTVYLKLQDEVDMLILIDCSCIKAWNPKAVEDFVLESTRIITGGVSENDIAYVLLGRIKMGEEQGWWAGKTALKILNGTAPSAIPVTTNKYSKVLLNMKLAKRMGIVFPMELIEEADFVEKDGEILP
ncbi:ABC transporter substrate-binding protein [Desulfobacter curvatus]|uniref:ABC transporter substrate-binding protein n=1 Tax=Desulfobacter curvatus TaxID=2290 RepID=UPI00036D156F|nr:ABC transporter substrate binding protein [Desulfobacter curvatus]